MVALGALNYIDIGDDDFVTGLRFWEDTVMYSLEIIFGR